MTQMILLMGLGLVLILAEVLIPSMGMLGIAAGVCVIGSVAWGFATSSEIGMNLLLVAAVLVPLMVMLGFKLLPLSPLTKKLIAGGFSFEDGKATDPRDADLVGQRGVVEATLRPAGVARLDGRRVDVVSRGEMIEAGTEVEVVEVSGNRVVVSTSAHVD